jgi:DeoR/GlpR family transcriptional regulator of sugar metabolism
MGESLFVEERRRAILDQLKQNGRVSVKALSEAMSVSAVTIRQDLRALEEEGLLERTYGGAVRRENPPTLLELSFHTRLKKRRRAKEALAAAASAMLHEDISIAMDASTTVYAMVPFIKNCPKLTVVTNCLTTAHSFLDSPHIQVLLPGGRLRRDSISIVGNPDGLPDINVNIGFFGAHGLSLMSGVSDVDADEVSLKRAMVARSAAVVILVDGGKWGQIAPYTFARFNQVERIITTDDAPANQVAQVRDAGTRVDVVTVEHDE